MTLLPIHIVAYLKIDYLQSPLTEAQEIGTRYQPSNHPRTAPTNRAADSQIKNVLTKPPRTRSTVPGENDSIAGNTPSSAQSETIADSGTSLSSLEPDNQTSGFSHSEQETLVEHARENTDQIYSVTTPQEAASSVASSNGGHEEDVLNTPETAASILNTSDPDSPKPAIGTIEPNSVTAVDDSFAGLMPEEGTPSEHDSLRDLLEDFANMQVLDLQEQGQEPPTICETEIRLEPLPDINVSLESDHMPGK